jgi:GNAT superfamily N-acetyltransferase
MAESPLTVRPYRSTDHDAVMALADRLSIGVAPWRDPSAVAGAVRSWVAGSIEGVDPEDSPVFVAADARDLVGFVSCGRRAHWTGESDAYVGELVVAEPAQGRGVARALMSAAEDWARQGGVRRLTIETGAANDGARAFYAAIGYAEEEVVLSRGL